MLVDAIILETKYVETKYIQNSTGRKLIALPGQELYRRNDAPVILRTWSLWIGLIIKDHLYSRI